MDYKNRRIKVIPPEFENNVFGCTIGQFPRDLERKTVKSWKVYDSDSLEKKVFFNKNQTLERI